MNDLIALLLTFIGLFSCLVLPVWGLLQNQKLPAWSAPHRNTTPPSQPRETATMGALRVFGLATE